MLTERLLQIQGYETTVVSNGVLALKKYETEEFDLLLIDIQMPEMDGMELIRRIREKEKITRAHVPVLVLTAHMMPDDLRTFIESGADGCIPKPVMMDQLRNAIQKLLHEGSLGRLVELESRFDRWRPALPTGRRRNEEKD